MAEAVEAVRESEGSAVEVDEPQARPDWKERFASLVREPDAEGEDAHDAWGYPEGMNASTFLDEEGTFIQLSCEVVKLSEIQKLVVTHSNSDTDFKKSTLIIKVQNSIRNPSTSKESSFFTIHSYLLDEASGQYFLVD